MNNVSSCARDRLGRALDSGASYGVAALVIMSLLASFYAVLLVNMNAIDEKTEDLKEHPYAVAVAAGRAETLLMQLRTLDDRLSYARSPQTLASVNAEFASIDEKLQGELDIIERRHRSSPEETESLVSGYAAFREEQRELVKLSAGDASDEEVAAFLSSTINPRIDAMLRDDAAIVSAASRSFDQLYTAAFDTRANAIGTSTVLMVAVVTALVLFLFAIRRKNRQQAELQRNLQRALEKEHDASDAKSRFLSNVSHDIRTPLTAIIGLTDIAMEHADDRERVEQSLEKVRLSSHHLLNLVNDVLDMSKIESGQIDLRRAPFDIRVAVEALASMVRPQADTKHLRFEVQRVDVRDGLVLGDEMRVSQVLINLLGNAVKYTEPGGLVSLVVEELEGDAASEGRSDAARMRLIRFIVEDDGIGMSKEFVSRVFEPFEREDVPARLNVEGTGLGMAISKNLADLMGGSIEVQSQRNHGSRFTLTLPFEACEEDEGAERPTDTASTSMLCEPGAQAASEEAEARAWSHVRVLLAEDNEIVGEIAEEFIRETGASLDRAWNGREALDLLQGAPENTYDLVFMDIQMPCMDGLEAAREMVDWCRSEGRGRPPIIAMTANAYVEDRRRAFGAGMDGFVVKPIGSNEIRRLFQTYVGCDGDG